MKKSIIATLAVCSFFALLPSAKALTSYAIKDKCTIKTEANENGSFLVENVIHYLDPGDVITLVDGSKVASTNSKCSTDYYYVTFSGKKGYVCGDYINFNAEGKYYDELRNAGFPESYLLSLNALKEQHPNWEFSMVPINLDWQEAITNESNVEYDSYNDRYWSRSYIQSTNELYLSKQVGSYNTDGTPKQLEAGGWYAANKQTVAYYMDPRNFLNIYDIFMFEDNKFNSKNQTLAAISSIFSGTDLSNYSNIYLQAANLSGNNISPTLLAARSRQEVVLPGGSLSSAANGSKEYYNFFNIGAFSSCINPILCGTNFASGKGWTTAESAISGGASWINDNYVANGQDTIYFQKFDVKDTSSYSHQYMTNITAPKSESAEFLYSGYEKANTLNETIHFMIPVYNNMSEYASPLYTSIDEVKKDALSGDILANISQLGYIIKNNYVIAESGKKRNDFTNEMRAKEMNATITSKNTLNSDVLATGDMVTIDFNGKSENYIVVVKGDANGDGAVNASDYLKIKYYIMETGSLDGAYKDAADYNNDNKTNASDYKLIKDYIMSR